MKSVMKSVVMKSGLSCDEKCDVGMMDIVLAMCWCVCVVCVWHYFCRGKIKGGCSIWGLTCQVVNGSCCSSRVGNRRRVVVWE